jgi:hypothetical protein
MISISTRTTTYAQRLEEMNSMKSNHTTKPTGIPTEGYENQVQSTGQCLAPGFKMPLRHQNTCNSPGTLYTSLCTGRIPIRIDPLPSLDDITAITKRE